MDPTSIALSLVTASAQSFSTSVAMSVEKTALNSDKQIAQLLAQTAQTSSGALAPGVGGNLDVTA